MTENQKLALIAAAAPNTVLKLNSVKAWVAVHREADPPRAFPNDGVIGLVRKRLLKYRRFQDGHYGLALTEAGRRAVEEMVRK